MFMLHAPHHQPRTQPWTHTGIGWAWEFGLCFTMRLLFYDGLVFFIFIKKNDVRIQDDAGSGSGLHFLL
jgi:hypothetical protein